MIKLHKTEIKNKNGESLNYRFDLNRLHYLFPIFVVLFEIMFLVMIHFDNFFEILHVVNLEILICFDLKYISV
jgi:hypothetical protein